MKSKTKLTPKQEQFCINFVSEEFFGNGTQSYIDAYGIDVTKTGEYQKAASSAYDNLIKPYICERINELLSDAGLNDQFVDKQLLLLITQNADFSSKVRAINEYNKLKQRITDKIKQEVSGNLSMNQTIFQIKTKGESKAEKKS